MTAAPAITRGHACRIGWPRWRTIGTAMALGKTGGHTAPRSRRSRPRVPAALPGNTHRMPSACATLVGSDLECIAFLSPVPTIADKRLFILTYLPHHPTRAGLGHLLGLSQSNAHNAHKWMRRLHAMLSHALARQAFLLVGNADDLAVMPASSEWRASLCHPYLA